MDEQQLRALSHPISRIFLEQYLHSQAPAVSRDLSEISGALISEPGVRRRAIRIFETIGDRSAECLESVLLAGRKSAVETHELLRELAATLDRSSAAELFGAEMSIVDAEASLRSTRPLPKDIAAVLGERVTASYWQLLATALRLLRETVVALPPFEPKAVPGSIERLERSQSSIFAILEGVKGVETYAARSEEQPEIARLEADFRHEVLRTQDYLELFGADIAPESRRHALTVAYVSLNLDAEADRESSEPTSMSAAELLGTLSPEAGRILIRGEAGSGKSTLFRWAALRASGQNSLEFTYFGNSSEYILTSRHAAIEYAGVIASYPIGVVAVHPIGITVKNILNVNMENQWFNRIPFLIRLRDCPGGCLPGAAEIAKFINHLWPSAPANWVQTQLDMGRALLLLDGIDEVPNLKRGALAKAVREIVECYPDNYYLLSTRPEAVAPNLLKELGFRETRINPMSDDDRGQFVDRWHSAVGAELNRNGRNADGLTRLAQMLKEQLANNPTIARLGTNPLLCGMICALHRDRYTRLPKSLAELCEALCHMLLHRREDENQLNLSQFPPAYQQLTYEQKRCLVQKLAEHMVLNEESALDAEFVEQQLGQTLNEFASGDAADAKVVFRTLVERSGMLREARPGRIDFIHNTLKEFLAAECFAIGNHVGFLVSKALDDAWQPVLIFAAATRQAAQRMPQHGSKNFASELISRLLANAVSTHDNVASLSVRRRGKQPKPTNGTRPGYILMALRCAAVALTIEQSVRRTLDEAIRPLFPPQTLSDAEILAYGGNEVVPLLRHKTGRSARVAASCVRALRRIGTHSAIEAIREYRDEPFLTILDEVSQAIDPLECSFVRSSICSSENGLTNKIRGRIIHLNNVHDQSHITTLDLTHTNIENLEALKNFGQLRSLSVDILRIEQLRIIQKISTLKFLTINLFNCAFEIDLSTTKIEHLKIEDYIFNDPEVEPTNIFLPDTVMVLHSNFALKLFSNLSSVKNLSLNASLKSSPTDLEAIQNMPNCSNIHLSYWSNIGPLRPSSEGISEAAILAELLSGLSAFNTIKSVQGLVLSVIELTDVVSLRDVTKLTELDISGSAVTDLSPLRHLPNLIKIDIRRTNVRDISPLIHVKHILSDLSQKQSLTMRTNAKNVTVDVALLIALEEEFKHFISSLEVAYIATADPESGGFYYELERSSARGGKYRIVATLIGEMGSTAAALSADRLRRKWQPRCMAMLGIAGGISADVLLGDVVLATQSDAYQENAKAVRGASDDAFTLQLSGEVYRCEQSLARFARHLQFARPEEYSAWLKASKDAQAQLFGAETQNFAEQKLIRPEPKLVCGHVASGTTVSANQAFCEFLKKRDRNLLAIEMESAGMMAAVPGLRTLVLRGISDFGDERKSALDRSMAGGFRTYAMRNAIAAFFALLDAGALDA